MIVNYNAGDYLKACVDSLLAIEDPRLDEIIVIDNGSTDTSLTNLTPGSAKIVDSGGNVGYARAANLGVAVTCSPYVAVLNPDVVCDPNFSRPLCECLDADASVGAAGPAIRDLAGVHYPSARTIPSLATALGHFVLGMIRPQNRWTRRYRQSDTDPTERRTTAWLSGAAVMLRRSALDAVGGWDERFFMFMEDVDLYTRLTAGGWAVWFEPASSVMHVEGVSRRSHPYRTLIAHHRSAFLYANLHWSGLRRAALPAVAAALAVRCLALLAVAAVRTRAQH